MKASFLAAIVLFLGAVLPTSGAAQNAGFAGLGQDIAGFAQPQVNQPWEFPKDHAAHPNYRIEWWYVTANLQDKQGRDFGVQWTLFRSALRPETVLGWNDPQIWMGHAAITSATQQLTAQRFARGGVGIAGAKTTPFEAWIDEWKMQGSDDFSSLFLTAGGADFTYDLNLETDKPLIFHGQNGYSVKSEGGQASRYYSQSNYQVTGKLMLLNEEIEVTGTAWLDREFSSQPLAPDQQGWDWFSLNFDDGSKAMVFRLRGTRDFYAGTWITPNGAASALAPAEIILTPKRYALVAGRKIPVDWQVILPTKGVDISVSPLNDQSWMPGLFAYWEGPILINGTRSGRGYLEMTGYE